MSEEREEFSDCECDGCGDPIYTNESRLEYEGPEYDLFFHDDDQCLALWLRTNSELVSKNDR